jgi:hypothetical protein
VNEHTSHLQLLAELHTEQVSQRARGSEPPQGADCLLRGLERLRQGVVRKLREIVQEHWDLALFDILFGSVKAFGIYPALYFAGLAWTIPLMEYAPLNTQLWTAGYLFARGEVSSQLGRRRYGHPLKELDTLRDLNLGVHPPDARSIHHLRVGGMERSVRIRRSRLGDWWRRLRGQPRERNVLLQAELRTLIFDREFLFFANPLRNNAHLYEKVLLTRILETPEARAALLARLEPEEPLKREGRALRAAIGETHTPAVARVVAGGDALTATLAERLGPESSASRLALRFLHWSYQRRVYSLLDRQRILEYRLLAELADLGDPKVDLGDPKVDLGDPTAGTERDRITGLPAHEPLRRGQSEVSGWISRAEAFAAKAKAVATRAEARRLLAAAVPEARNLGLSARLARAACWWSVRFEPAPLEPSARSVQR